MWIILAAALLMSLTMGSVNAAPAIQDGCPGNLLENPGFEGGSRKTDYLGTSLSSAVADGWIPWFIRGGESENREPEFKVEQTAVGGDPFRVRSGANSQKWFTTWATHTAGVYQKVQVRPGVPLTFSAYGMIYTGEGDGWSDADKTFYSDPVKPGEYRIWVGIDPTGAEPAGMGSDAPASVIWSEPRMEMDQFVPLEVSAVPQSSTVTVYLKGQPRWAVKHNDSFWDDACLRTGGNPAPAPAPQQAVEEQAQEAEPAVDETAAEPTEEPEAEAVETPTDEDQRQDEPETPVEDDWEGPIVPPMYIEPPLMQQLPPVPGKQWAVPW
jgi:hypothetical protein